MNLNVDQGGYAFSLPMSYATNGEVASYAEYGMTMRDYFAAKAMQGMLASDVRATHEELANYSYEMADAMLKAREV